MAEFCLECWCKLNGTRKDRWRYMLSLDKDLCETCGEFKRVVVGDRSLYWEKPPIEFKK